MLSSIFFRTEIREEYKANKWAHRQSIVPGKQSHFEQKNETAASTQKSHLRLSHRRKLGS